jgi:hypothetical protein
VTIDGRRVHEGNLTLYEMQMKRLDGPPDYLPIQMQLNFDDMVTKLDLNQLSLL